jgi:GDSL-like Lipase/Acylhydrolase family
LWSERTCTRDIGGSPPFTGEGNDMRETCDARAAAAGLRGFDGVRGLSRLRLALGGLVVAGMCAALPAGAGAAGASYVAMGDSYTSAPGVLPVEPTAPPECGQSEVNYPHLVAAALKLSLTDVSCGGARTENFTVAQYPDQPPQFDALGESTEVVSLGMGGNDGGLFGTLLLGCTETDINTPGKAPCKEKYQGFVTKTFEEDKAPYEAALAEIHVLAPKAKVFVVGYPEITPQHGGCTGAIPWTPDDLKWFRDKVQKFGNKNLKAEAKANGAIFVDTFKPSEGHNACTPIGTRWIEPLIGSLTGVPVHPNATGEENDAFDVEQAMLDNGVR